MLIKVDKDTLLDKIYELRSKIDFTNSEALEKITELIDIVVKSPDGENQSTMPKIRFGR